MKYLSLLALFITITAFYYVRQLMDADFKDSAAYRWLNKKIYMAKTLDDMEYLDHWKSFTSSGVQVVDARKVMTTPDSSGTVADLSLSTDFVHHGSRSLLMTIPTRLRGPAPLNGRGWGRSGVRRIFDGENWTKYNRISIWIYPDLPGFYTTALDAQLSNNGKVKLPTIFGQEGQTSWVLKNHQWNHIVWEISNVARDKITSLEMSYGLSGSYPGEGDKIHFYFDQLELEKVDPDKIEGWDVWKGRIAYAHTGYQTGAQKSAIGSYLNAQKFQLIDQSNGKIVLNKLIKHKTSAIGDFQVMDFSEIRKPGIYILKAGETATQPFRIEADVYERTIWKALNFFYAERCGAEIPGIHGNEHNDWVCIHGNRRIVTNGGWHDAGDLSQSFEGTAENTTALLSMAEKLKKRNDNPKLYDRVLEEAQWGLDWILKNNFGDGFRNTGSLNSRRTNDIIGDDDDPVTYAQNSPMANFEAAGVEALAYSVFKEENPRLAEYALKTAKADWDFASKGLPSIKTTADIWRGTFDSNNVEDELPAQAIISSIALWTATHEIKYENEATGMAPLIVNAQQRKRPDWVTPLTGFYYTSTEHKRILHYCHRGREQAPTLALTELCNAFPNDRNWMKWYASVTLYSEYLKTLAKYSEPYQMMPASIYVDTEYKHVPESRQASFHDQVLQGIPLGKGHYLRIFPVWMDYRGNFGTILPQAQALASAGKLRSDPASEELAIKQLEWIIGKNPFSESTMYGEGHDYVPLYSPSSGDMVGGLPVGIQTREAGDSPYWPVQAIWTYKEIWGHPVTNWIWLLKDVEGPAIVEGYANAAVKFRDSLSGAVVTVLPNISSNHFKVTLPEGKYKVSSEGLTQSQTFLPGSSYEIECRPKLMLSYTISKQEAQNGQIVIRVTAYGQGEHHLNLRTDNLCVKENIKEIRFKNGNAVTVEWQGRIASTDEPWVAVIIPDKNISGRKELRGQIW
jgi:hypothetical protein